MKNVLVIEDNMGVADLITDKLNEFGYTSQIAATGKQAIEMLQQTMVDMVILDYSLPDMDGKEIIDQISKLGLTMPSFVVSTGRGDEQLAVDMMKLGAYDYLIKDRTLIDRLPEILNKLVYEKQREQQLTSARKALEDSEQRFRNFVEKSSDFFVKISPEGRFAYVSPNWENHLGYNGNQLYNKQFFSLIHPDDSLILKKLVQNSVKSENQHFTYEYRIINNHGQWKHHAITGYSLKENERVFVNCIARDITEKKNADKIIAKAVLEAEENEKKRFAEELHEGIGPLISTIKMSMGRIKVMREFNEDELKLINYCDNLVDAAVTQIRTVANDLVPNVINDFGFLPALRAFVKKASDDDNVELSLFAPVDIPNPEKIMGLILYRIITWLVHNSVKHTRASQVDISLQLHKKNLYVLYTDNGGPFPSAKNSDGALNDNIVYGLENIKKRLEAFDGSISFAKGPSGAKVVKLILPLQASRE